MFSFSLFHACFLFNSCNVIGVLSVMGKRREPASFCPEELIVSGMYILNIYVKTKQYVIVSVTDLYFPGFSVCRAFGDLVKMQLMVQQGLGGA